jgi:hypothetical protein
MEAGQQLGNVEHIRKAKLNREPEQYSNHHDRGSAHSIGAGPLFFFSNHVWLLRSHRLNLNPH